VGSRPTAPTPKLGDQDFLSGLSPLAFGVTTPLLQGNKICNPRQGPLQGAISRGQLNPVFFFEAVTPLPPHFSTGLGTGYGGVIIIIIIIVIIIIGIIIYCIYFLYKMYMNCYRYISGEHRHSFQDPFYDEVNIFRQIAKNTPSDRGKYNLVLSVTLI
jgi:hypothetical protein